MHIYFNKCINLASLIKSKSITIEWLSTRCSNFLYCCHSLDGPKESSTATESPVTHPTSRDDLHSMSVKPARSGELKLVSRTTHKAPSCVTHNIGHLNKLIPPSQGISLLKQHVRHFSTSSLRCASVSQPEALVSDVLATEVVSSVVPDVPIIETEIASSVVSDIIATEVSNSVVSDVPVMATEVSSSVYKLYFSEFPTIQGAEKFLQYLHDITGLPWWASILLSGFFMRGLLLIPVSIHTQRNQSRLQALAPEMKEKAVILKAEVSRAVVQLGWNEKRAKKEFNKNMSRILKELYIRDNCHPMKNVAVFWIQTPVFLSLSYSLRNIVTRAEHTDMVNHEVFQSLSTEGLAWVPDLAAVDKTFILPSLVFLVTLFNIEFAYLNLPAITTYRKWLSRILMGVSVTIIPISSVIPSAVVLYWISSGFFAAVQNVLFEYSSFRRLCRLPESPTESNNPLKSLAQKARTRYFSQGK